MKKLITLITICNLQFAISNVNAQTTTVYADSVWSFSTEYGTSNANCTGSWAACKIKGAPDVYPNCGDIGGAWAFFCANQREFIVVGYSTHLFVDTVRVWETNHSGDIDTVYLRDAATHVWHTVYADSANFVTTCNVLSIAVPITSYRVDAVRLAISNAYYTIACYPEYDAVALIGQTFMAGINQLTIDNEQLIISPNPVTSNLTISQFENLKIEEVRIFNLLGECILKSELRTQNSEVSVDVSSLSQGVYFVRVNNTINKKFVKQ